MSKINWVYQGIAVMGDADGEISIYKAEINGRTITKTQPRVARTTYTVNGQQYKKLSDAVAATNVAKNNPAWAKVFG